MFKTCLRRTADLTPTQSEDDMSSGSASEGEGDGDTRPGDDPLPGSSDFSDHEPRRGPGPYGPPPPLASESAKKPHAARPSAC